MDNKPKTDLTPEEDLMLAMETQSFKTITVELSERVLDSALDEGLIKEIPIVRILYSVVQGVRSIRDYLFSKKVLEFLATFNDLDESKRQQFFRDLSKGEKQRFAETVIMLLDRFTEMQKAELLGLIVKASINGEISKDDMYRLFSIIDRLYIPDLFVFIDTCSDSQKKHIYTEELGEQATVGLVSAGLIYHIMLPVKADGVSRGTLYGITDSAKSLAHIVRKYKMSQHYKA